MTEEAKQRSMRKLLGAREAMQLYLLLFKLISCVTLTNGSHPELQVELGGTRSGKLSYTNI